MRVTSPDFAHVWEETNNAREPDLHRVLRESPEAFGFSVVYSIVIVMIVQVQAACCVRLATTTTTIDDDDDAKAA